MVRHGSQIGRDGALFFCARKSRGLSKADTGRALLHGAARNLTFRQPTGKYGPVHTLLTILLNTAKSSTQSLRVGGVCTIPG